MKGLNMKRKKERENLQSFSSAQLQQPAQKQWH